MPVPKKTKKDKEIEAITADATLGRLLSQIPQPAVAGEDHKKLHALSVNILLASTAIDSADDFGEVIASSLKAAYYMRK